MSYTLDQQLTDVEEAIKILNDRKSKGYSLYLCSIATRVSGDFLQFIKRAFKRIDKISPESYKNSLVDAESIRRRIEEPVSPAIWISHNYESRLQFLNDLKEDIIENG